MFDYVIAAVVLLMFLAAGLTMLFAAWGYWQDRKWYMSVFTVLLSIIPFWMTGFMALLILYGGE